MNHHRTAPIHIEPDLEGLVDRQSCVRASHPRQAVVAHQIHNSGGITYGKYNPSFRNYKGFLFQNLLLFMT